MKIAQIAPIEETVPPQKYGGTELVVSHLTEELVSRGHDVTLFASGDSKTKANLIALVPNAVRNLTRNESQKSLRETWKVVALRVLAEKIFKEKYDLIHTHYGHRFKILEPLIDLPIIETCHGEMASESVNLIFNGFSNSKNVSISFAQQFNNYKIKYVGNVYNGIDLDRFSFSSKGGDYFAFLGRVSPSKGIKEAILIAKQAGVNLKIAAKIDFVDLKYYKAEVEPLIDGKQIEYIGEIGPNEKNEFLMNARALLAPIQWEEPFGLYFVEAMACGTPVVVFDRGSAREVVINNKTGFVCPKNDMKYAIEKIILIKNMPEEKYVKMRYDSRKHVKENFTIQKMVDGYEKIYKRVIEDWRNSGKNSSNRRSGLYRLPYCEEFSQRRL